MVGDPSKELYNSTDMSIYSGSLKIRTSKNPGVFEVFSFLESGLLHFKNSDFGEIFFVFSLINRLSVVECGQCL